MQLYNILQVRIKKRAKIVKKIHIQEYMDKIFQNLFIFIDICHKCSYITIILYSLFLIYDV